MKILEGMLLTSKHWLLRKDPFSPGRTYILRKSSKEKFKVYEYICVEASITNEGISFLSNDWGKAATIGLISHNFQLKIINPKNKKTMELIFQDLTKE